PEYEGRPERAIVIAIEAWDVNCPQHITRRFADWQIGPAIERLQARIAELEAEVARLRSAAGEARSG
ncbi:MAG TPA: pyridoxamine 5'-phosphate oxidase, partial [Alphaproteobacteria bacterium]|nr:pyridoxamine 5'-phosphate oxidase [Alphaproteobacteria bacterium]